MTGEQRRALVSALWAEYDEAVTADADAFRVWRAASRRLDDARDIVRDSDGSWDTFVTTARGAAIRAAEQDALTAWIATSERVEHLRLMHKSAKEG